MAENIIKQLRENLKPQGTKPVVRISIEGFFPEEFITQVIDDLSLKGNMVATGMDEFNAIDKLVFEVLKESAGIE